MQLVFQGGSQIVKLVIDREKKIFHGASTKSNYQLISMPWKQLFDNEEEEKMAEKLDDADFKKTIIESMKNAGYKLKQ